MEARFGEEWVQCMFSEFVERVRTHTHSLPPPLSLHLSPPSLLPSLRDYSYTISLFTRIIPLSTVCPFLIVSFSLSLSFLLSFYISLRSLYHFFCISLSSALCVCARISSLCVSAEDAKPGESVQQQQGRGIPRQQQLQRVSCSGAGGSHGRIGWVGRGKERRNSRVDIYSVFF